MKKRKFLVGNMGSDSTSSESEVGDEGTESGSEVVFDDHHFFCPKTNVNSDQISFHEASVGPAPKINDFVGFLE